jgi:5-methylcytosine-specific restriction endonuclease McrA
MKSSVCIVRRQRVLVKDPHVKSLGSLVKLSRYYMSLPECSSAISWKKWVKLRGYFLSKQKRKGLLFCWYCGKGDLVSRNNRHNSLTIDHMVPVCRGGTHDEENLAVCCGHCNKDKGEMLLDDFISSRNFRNCYIRDKKRFYYERSE